MKEDFLDCDAARIPSLLDTLVREHLLQREDVPGSDTARWAAHPIVRDVFRGEALKAGDTIATQFAEIVAGKGERGIPKSVAELQPILEAIEVLLAAEDFNLADKVFSERLENGRVFQWIPAPQEGLRCGRGFVEPASRKQALEEGCGRGRLAFHLNATALFGTNLGEMENVEQRCEQTIEIWHARQSWVDLCSVLQNLADVQMLRGTLQEAVETMNEALFYAGVEEARMRLRAAHRFPKRPAHFTRERPSDSAVDERDSRACRGEALSLLGELSAASRDFEMADAIERKNDPDNDALHSQRGIQWCSHRLRLGDAARGRWLTEANRVICKRFGWNSDLTRCDLLLVKLDLKAGNFDSAAQRIGDVVHIFREARLGQFLPEALLAQAQLRRSLEDCEEALRLAARSGFAQMQCDALNLRALLRREAGAHDKAVEDAHQALEIAERCGYYWGHMKPCASSAMPRRPVETARTKSIGTKPSKN